MYLFLPLYDIGVSTMSPRSQVMVVYIKLTIFAIYGSQIKVLVDRPILNEGFLELRKWIFTCKLVCAFISNYIRPWTSLILQVGLTRHCYAFFLERFNLNCGRLLCGMNKFLRFYHWYLYCIVFVSVTSHGWDKILNTWDGGGTQLTKKSVQYKHCIASKCLPSERLSSNK